MCIASNAFAIQYGDHDFKWETNYGHWNKMFTLWDSGDLNGTGTIVIKSSGQEHYDGYWQIYYDYDIQGSIAKLKHTGLGFGINNQWYNNAGTGTKAYYNHSLNTYGNEVKSIAHNKGWTGQNTTLYIADWFSGVNGNHGETVTAIARGANAKGGYAPNADLIFYDFNSENRYYDTTTNITGDSTLASTWEDIPYATRAKHTVVNYSFGTGNPTAYANAIKNDKGRIYVVAQGNGGKSCNTTSNCYTSNNGTNYHSISVGLTNKSEHSAIAVGALDGSTIASYSNKAGFSKEFYIVADGNSYNSSGTKTGHGTSYAAPRIAGAAALTWSKFDNLNAGQVREILLGTADDLGAVGTDDVYGRGRLNVEAALSPIGHIR